MIQQQLPVQPIVSGLHRINQVDTVAGVESDRDREALVSEVGLDSVSDAGGVGLLLRRRTHTFRMDGIDVDHKMGDPGDVLVTRCPERAQLRHVEDVAACCTAVAPDRVERVVNIHALVIQRDRRPSGHVVLVK
jgi:hypothetical protein